MTTELTPSELKARLKALGLFGLIACCDEIIDKPWLREVLAIEERERQKRGLERRTRDARVGAVKPMADFDWDWPKKIDRQAMQNDDPQERRDAGPHSWPHSALRHRE
jgi:hypothetical protein